MLQEFKFKNEDFDKIIEAEMKREAIENEIIQLRTDMSKKYGYTHTSVTLSPKGHPYFLAEPITE